MSSVNPDISLAVAKESGDGAVGLFGDEVFWRFSIITRVISVESFFEGIADAVFNIKL